METNIHAVIGSLRTEHPSAGDTRLVELLIDRLQSDQAALVAAARYLISTIIVPARAGLDAQLQKRTAPPEQKARERAQVRTAASAVAARVLLLNLVMPNGKPMRACSGEEMAGFGAGYARIAEKVGNALVGAVLDERQVQALMKTGQDWRTEPLRRGRPFNRDRERHATSA
ncbi:MAG: hypothetical protein ACLP0B_19490 [Steroidobacteraceae bacterium]